jgi:hypothetical protein
MKTYGGVEAHFYSYLISVLQRSFTLWLLYTRRKLPSEPTAHETVQTLIWWWGQWIPDLTASSHSFCWAHSVQLEIHIFYFWNSGSQGNIYYFFRPSIAERAGYSFGYFISFLEKLLKWLYRKFAEFILNFISNVTKSREQSFVIGKSTSMWICRSEVRTPSHFYRIR